MRICFSIHRFRRRGVAPVIAVASLGAMLALTAVDAVGKSKSKKSTASASAASRVELVGPPWPMKFSEVPPTMDKIVVSSVAGLRTPTISMTFDDGPHPQHTPRLLGILRERNIKATFFVLGQCAQAYPAIMQQIMADGHEIASHSWSHPLLSRQSETKVFDELDRTQKLLTEVTGHNSHLMRPPYGGLTLAQKRWVNRLWGHKIILWDVDSYDWKTRSAQKTQAIILRDTRPGSIVLCHDIHGPTVDAMPATLDGLIAKGFQFTTVGNLLAMGAAPAPPAEANPAAVRRSPLSPPIRLAPDGTPPADQPTPADPPAALPASGAGGTDIPALPANDQAAPPVRARATIQSR